MISYNVSEKYSFAITSLHNENVDRRKGRKSLNKFYEHLINVKKEKFAKTDYFS